MAFVRRPWVMCMTKAEFEDWLRSYGRAWESRDPEAAATLFTKDARYHETPFGEPVLGRDGIHEYWAAATVKQRDVRFSYEILCIQEELGIARWSADYLRHPEGEGARLNGIFVLKFDGAGLCQELREWWHKFGP